MSDRPFARGFWLVAGLFFTGCAFIGVLLPLIPTTPFLLLAAFCFARSSERFHKWLYEHKVFGPLLTNWNKHGAISRRAKISAGVCLAMAPVLSLLVKAPLWTLGVQIPVLLCSALFIFTRPDGPRDVIDPADQTDA